MEREIRSLSGVSESKNIERLGGASGRRGAEQQASVKSAERASSAAAAARGRLPAEEFGVPVPPEFLADPQKMKTEWGWRRFLVQTLNEGRTATVGNTAPSEPQVPSNPQLPSEPAVPGKPAVPNEPPSPNGLPAPNQQPILQETGEIMQKLVQTLWQTLHPLLQEPAMQGQTLPAAGWVLPGALLPLSDLQEHQYRNAAVPEKLKRMAVSEKLQLAVKSPLMPIVGSGFFYPPIYAEDDRREAVYWQAERHPLTDEQGSPAQHLLLKLEVDGEPMELHFVFTPSAFTLHIRTDDATLRKDLADSQPIAQSALQAVGWELSQFSIGKLAETRGEL